MILMSDRKNEVANISDVYFIFADNVYLPFLSFDQFKALINFYALLYKRIIIPDTFFINNKFLIEFLQNHDGFEFLKQGIIVPSVRSEITSLKDLYEQFIENGTLVITEKNQAEMLSYLEVVDISNNALHWNTKDIAVNFSSNIIKNIKSLSVNDEDKIKWLENIDNIKINGILTRKNIREITDKIQLKDENSSKIFKSYVDVLYNFNIPNFFGTSAAYPEALNIQQFVVSPQEVFFSYAASRPRLDAVIQNDIINTSFFNIGVLSNLTIDHVVHFRKTKGFKKFVKCLMKPITTSTDNNLRDFFIDYIDEFDTELPMIIKKENRRYIEINQKKLKIMNIGRDGISDDGVGIFVEVILDGVASLIGSKILGKVLSILMRPLSVKTERELKKMELLGKNEIGRIQSRETIRDTIKGFSLNTIKQ